MPDKNYWRNRFNQKGIYPILDIETCENQNIDIYNLLSIWERYRNLIPIIQLRYKNANISDLKHVYNSIQKKTDLPVIINDYWQEAIEWNAFGFHIGKEDWQTSLEEEKLRIEKANCLKGTSSHDLPDIQKLNPFIWDYTGFGPVFPTTSKQTIHSDTGIDLLLKAKKISKIPIVPIGGINSNNFAPILKREEFTFAVIGAALKEEEWVKFSLQLMESDIKL